MLLRTFPGANWPWVFPIFSYVQSLGSSKYLFQKITRRNGSSTLVRKIGPSSLHFGSLQFPRTLPLRLGHCEISVAFQLLFCLSKNGQEMQGGCVTFFCNPSFE